MRYYLDLDIVKADNTGSKGNTPSGPSLTSGNKKPKTYNQPVHYIPKSKYPKRPMNALGETTSSWIVPQGSKGGLRPGKPTTEAKGSTAGEVKSPSVNDSSVESTNTKPTPEEHQKLSDLAAEAGNHKLAEKHKKLAQPLLDTSNKESNSSSKKDELKLPNSESEKAQNLIHNAKASESKKKAKEFLNSVPSNQKPALKQIIDALEDHETRPHIPTANEKKELRELTNAVNSITKPVESKRKETQKLFDSKMKDKQKADKEKNKLILRESKDKDKAAQKIKEREEKQAAKDSENKKKEEKKLVLKTDKAKERDKKESEKIAKKKEEAYNKLKEKLARDVQKPKSPEEEAARTTHAAEAKELLAKIDEALNDNKDNPELVKVLEAHRRVAATHADISRVPKKEDVKALKDSKGLMAKREKQQAKESKDQEKANKNVPQQVTQKPQSKPKNSFNTGRQSTYGQAQNVGETAAHQGVQDDAGANLSGKTVGALGTGVASAGHHLLGPDKERKSVKKEEPEQSSLGKSLVLQAFNKAFGNDSDIERNNDTFDDDLPTGLTSDLDDTHTEIVKSMNVLLPKRNTFESNFFKHIGKSQKNTALKGLKAIQFSEWTCSKINSSLESLKKGI